METQIFLQGTTPSQLADLINEGVKSQLEDLKKELNHQNAKEDLMSREQVLDLLQINASTLWHWQNKGKIPVYKFANKCYYKRSELMECLTLVKK